MALGGGGFTFMNKVLPGAYINFLSKDRPIVSLADRGYAAIPLELDWGVEDEIFSVDATEFLRDTKLFFGYDYTHDKIKPLRDLFINLKTGHFYRLNSGGAKATCDIGTAKYSGIRGNDLMIVVSANLDDEGSYEVVTYLDTTIVDRQTIVSTADLKDSDYIVFKTSWVITATAGTPLTGGTNGTVTGDSYQTFLDLSEQKYFNIMLCPSNEPTIKQLFITYTKRMRNDVGIKFQLVAYKVNNADNEGIISVFNPVTDVGELEQSLVYWTAGTEASCSIGFSGGDTYISLTNKAYDGEYTVDTNLRQSEIVRQHGLGQLVFHEVGKRIGGEYVKFVRVLEDINTFISFTVQKNNDFSLNEVIRVLDQIAIDIATLFNESFLGKVQNDAIGQASFKSNIVAHHRELERVRAIQNFNVDDVTVEKGLNKGDVVVFDVVEPVGTMTRLYMTVMVA